MGIYDGPKDTINLTNKKQGSGVYGDTSGDSKKRVSASEESLLAKDQAEKAKKSKAAAKQKSIAERVQQQAQQLRDEGKFSEAKKVESEFQRKTSGRRSASEESLLAQSRKNDARSEQEQQIQAMKDQAYDMLMNFVNFRSATTTGRNDTTGELSASFKDFPDLRGLPNPNNFSGDGLAVLLILPNGDPNLAPFPIVFSPYPDAPLTDA